MKNKKTLFIISFALIFIVALNCMVLFSLNGTCDKENSTKDNSVNTSGEIQLEDDDLEIMREEVLNDNTTESTTTQKNDINSLNKETENDTKDKINSSVDNNKEYSKTNTDNSNKSDDTPDDSSGDDVENNSDDKIELTFVSAK